MHSLDLSRIATMPSVLRGFVSYDILNSPCTIDQIRTSTCGHHIGVIDAAINAVVKGVPIRKLHIDCYIGHV